MALKVPKFDKHSDTEVKRFLREARAMANLRHQHLCPVYDAGEENGAHYMTMAYLQGQPMSKWIESGGRYTPRKLAVVLYKLATALATAHQAGVIHRDLKPANIMLVKENEPVVVDFGIASQCDPNETMLTRQGDMLGTPYYMSPEQARGDLKKIGPTIDVYALGVIGYELLCGKRPFDGTMSTVLAAVLRDQPVAPEEVAPGVDRQLQAICLKAMAKEPEDRYATAVALAEALRNYLKANPAMPGTVQQKASPPAIQVDAAKRKKKTKQPATGQIAWKTPAMVAGGVLAMLLMVGLGWWLAGGGESPEPPSGPLASKPPPSDPSDDEFYLSERAFSFYSLEGGLWRIYDEGKPLPDETPEKWVDESEYLSEQRASFSRGGWCWVDWPSDCPHYQIDVRFTPRRGYLELAFSFDDSKEELLLAADREGIEASMLTRRGRLVEQYGEAFLDPSKEMQELQIERNREGWVFRLNGKQFGRTSDSLEAPQGLTLDNAEHSAKLHSVRVKKL